MKIPKFGAITNPSKDIVGEIKAAHRLGYDYVEVGIEPPVTVEVVIKNKNKIMKELKKFNSPAVVHTGWWLDMGTQYDLMRKATVEEFKKCIDAASVLGIKYINIHSCTFGLHNEKSGKIVLNNFVASLKESVEYAKKLNIEVMLENTPDHGRFTSSSAAFAYIVNKVPGLKVHLDIAHAFIRGGMPEVKNYIIKYKKKIAHIHIHDNHGFGDEHLGLGEGNIDFEIVVMWLKKIKYNGTITFEVFQGKNQMKHAAQSREYFKKLWVKR